MVNTQILKFKWIGKVLTLLLIFSFSNSYGQLLQWNTFGNVGTETTEPSVFNNPSISAANLTQGAGITPAANGNRFGGSNWWNTGNTAAGNTITEAIVGNDYLQFIITPNAGCSVTPTSFVFSFDRSGTGPSTMVLRSSFDGFAADIGSIAVSAFLTTGNTITISGLTNIGTTTFRLYGIGATATGGTGGFDVSTDVVNVQLNGNVTCGTITTGVVSTSPFVLGTCTSTVAGTVAFTSTGTFNAGNVYTAQLSNSAGSFTAPVNIGTLSSTLNSGTITITIPAGTTSGAGYLIRVVASNPNTTGSNSAAFTITLTCTPVCPQMTGAFINACQGTCLEGDNEILFLNSGTYSIPVAPANIIVTYGTVSSPTVTYTDAFTTNAGQTANLNALSSASCATLFVDASVAGTIPANSVFMIVRSSSCFNFDFSSYCSAGTIYILYSTDASWGTGGNFTNGGSPGELRYFKTDFSAVGAGCVTNYNYEPDLLTLGADGDAVSFTSGGGAANAYFNNGCTPPPLVLPIELLDFYATKNEDKNTIVWKVASEENVVYYTIGKSDDGINFTEIGSIYSTNSIQVKNYNIIDESPFNDITYYRLGTKENDGSVYYHKIISVDEKSSDWNCIHYQQEQSLMIEFKNSVPKNSTIHLFDLSGKLLVEETVKESQTKINTQTFSEGIYFLKISTPYKIKNLKINISKN